ncbi:hypothetical protein [Chamaesiphon polymorphus]|uniref:Uncharacterized protein n=1 Tax=Chamaesiphon polymorphus CCALA 037 TaxID=2107692 RepID=A0A2T1G117_9CYAN|nr:hypothetical protein [Chamaesiphon polymorphus]PSB50927.1 hypothetical protein C7B77_22165 [Chamaesiphon polymorphus CCALA 037]
MKTIDFRNKPDRTKIKITKISDFFEICIPPYEYHLSIFFMAPFTFFWDGLLILIIREQLQLPDFHRSLFSLLPYCAIGIFLVYACVFILFRKISFRIDRHEISLTKTLFGRKIHREITIPKREIAKIIFTHSYSYRDSDGDFITGSAELRCESETKSISICGRWGGRLFDPARGVVKTESEVKWLAYEISEWLDKPLMIIERPTC